MAKNFFVSGETVEIAIDEGYWVRIKKHFSAADYDALINSMIEFEVAPMNREQRRQLKKDGMEAPVTQKLRNNTVDLLAIAIVDWNLTDGSGTVLPVTRENVAKLDADVSSFLEMEVNKYNPLERTMEARSQSNT